LQFGLKRLFAVLTVVGVFLAVLGLVAREYGTWILTLLAVRLVYVVPIILILAGAMWVARKLRDSPLRRWAGMHVLTWTALLVVGGPCLYFSLIAYSGPWLAARENAPGWIYLDGVGWPYPYWAAHESDGQRVWAANEGFPTEFFDPAAMAADVLIWLFLLASIAFTVEQWVRRTERESPFEWKRAAIAAVSLVITCLVLDFDDAFLRWSENWFWFLGVACGVYTGLLLVTAGGAYVWRRLRRRGEPAALPLS
jgi:protein-S-isoprenylcysteine O-methyltransferase Ste14